MFGMELPALERVSNPKRKPVKNLSVIGEKLKRLRSGHPARYMDLFAGCGGISLGFLTAGFQPIASVELDPCAAQSHGANFGRYSPGGDSAQHYVARDITEASAEEVFRDVGLKGPADRNIDILVGGPPCQAFARIGRAKLREQAVKRQESTAHKAFMVDGRVNLWERYVQFIRETKPIALLMENVPDILNHGGANVAELVADSLSKEGYEVRYTLLNSAWYGVPQMRERMILIGFHRECGVIPQFPSPTHHLKLPAGYIGAKHAARRVLRQNGSAHHRIVLDPEPTLPKAISVTEALSDLPRIHALNLLQKGQLKRGAKNPLEKVEYKQISNLSPFAELMRNWIGFSTNSHTTGHVFRYLPRDYKIFAQMGEGWDYPKVHAFVEQKIADFRQHRKAEGLPSAESNPEVRDFISRWRIPYDPTKFPNKWWKLESGKPSRTLLAHLGKDSYTHIHYDSKQARTITVREAARLQSFPDGFEFRGSMNPAFRQIGNAVPPLFAYALAVAIKQNLGLTHGEDLRVKYLGLDLQSIRLTQGIDEVGH